MAKTLEQSFERLEEIIAQMEKSDTTLDASFKMYQEGMKLVESCAIISSSLSNDCSNVFAMLPLPQ